MKMTRKDITLKDNAFFQSQMLVLCVHHKSNYSLVSMVLCRPKLVGDKNEPKFVAFGTIFKSKPFMF
jgi:hypothetical protein